MMIDEQSAHWSHSGGERNGESANVEEILGMQGLGCGMVRLPAYCGGCSQGLSTLTDVMISGNEGAATSDC